MSRETSRGRDSLKRVVGTARERLIWPALKPNTYGVYAALFDNDPSEIEVPRLLLVETAYGGSLARRKHSIGLPGGGAKKKRDEIKDWGPAAARRIGLFIDDMTPPPTDEDYVSHRDDEVLAETGINPDDVLWIDERDITGTVNGNYDFGRMFIGHLGGGAVDLSTDNSRGEISKVGWYCEDDILHDLYPNPVFKPHYALASALQVMYELQTQN